jgi:hypothetical protein
MDKEEIGFIARKVSPKAGKQQNSIIESLKESLKY